MCCGGRSRILRESAEKEDTMDRLTIVARLQPGKQDRAEELLSNGPPFDPEELGLHRHSAYLTASEVVFVFEAPEVEWIVNDLVDDPVLSSAFAPWRAILAEAPRLAHEHYHWTREQDKTGIGLGV
jgi:hypothetical protein